MIEELINASDLFLLVIAHPDDESMFFFPTIYNLVQTTSTSIPFRVLCLSNGSFDGAGREREKELAKAALFLGLDSRAVRILNDECLQDDPNTDWDTAVVRNCVGMHIKSLAKQHSPFKNMRAIRVTVITFDERGISGHRNHISVFK